MKITLLIIMLAVSGCQSHLLEPVVTIGLDGTVTTNSWAVNKEAVDSVRGLASSFPYGELIGGAFALGVGGWAYTRNRKLKKAKLDAESTKGI